MRGTRYPARSGLARGVLGAAALALLFSGPVRAATITNFPAGSIIIPRDECYQWSGNIAAGSIPAYCVNRDATSGNGIFRTYGLQWFLLKNGIRVYQIINSTKATAPGCPVGDETPATEGTMAGRDFCVVGGATSPVKMYNRTTHAADIDFFPSGTIAYRGGPIVIHQTDAAAALALIRTGNLPVNWGYDLTATYSDANIHVAQVPFSAPVYNSGNTPPRLVAVESGNSGIFVNYLIAAGLSFVGAGGTPATHGLVYDVVTMAEMQAGALDVATYSTVWFPHYGYSGSATNRAVYGTEIPNYLDAGGAAVFSCAAVDSAEEGCAADAPCGEPGYMSTGSNFTFNALPTTWGDGADEKWRTADVGHPFVQVDSMQMQLISGSTKSWKPFTSYLPGVVRLLYSYDTDGPVTNDDHDVLTFRFKDNDTAKGPVVYFGGHDYDDDGAPEYPGIRIYLTTMFTIAALAAPPVIKEVTRSSPIVVEGPLNSEADTFVFQGSWEDTQPPLTAALKTFNSASPSAWVFPATEGHMRAYTQDQLTSTRTDFDVVTSPAWDAEDQVPTDTGSSPATCSGGNRCVFTSGASGTNYYKTGSLQDVTAAWLGGLAVGGDNENDEDWACVDLDTVGARTTYASKVRGATLGGVDWSTPAYIPTTERVTGGTTRPTVLYFGGLDGMLHAFQVPDIESGDTTAWNTLYELWAWIPPNQFPRLYDNTAEIQASPAVSDFFGDFLNAGSPGQDGVNEWRTVLSIVSVGKHQNGDYDSDGKCGLSDAAEGAAPALDEPGRGTVYMLDVSDPTEPLPLWESSPADLCPGTTACARPNGDDETGAALSAPNGAVGDVQGTAHGVVGCDRGTLRNLVFLSSKRPGTSPAAGFNVHALDARTGATVWSFSRSYGRRTQAGHSQGEANVTPGTISVADKTGLVGCTTHVYVGDLEGRVWELDARTGQSLGQYANSQPVVWNGASTTAKPVYDTSDGGAATMGCPSGDNGVIKCPIGPISVGRDLAGNLHVVLVTAYFDWSAPGIRAQIVNVNVANSAAVTDVLLMRLGVNERVYTGPVLYGNDVYLISTLGGGDVHAVSSYGTAAGSGTAYRFNLTSAAQTTLSVNVGMSGSAIAIGSGNAVIATGAQGIMKLTNPTPDLTGAGKLNLLDENTTRILLWVQGLL